MSKGEDNMQQTFGKCPYCGKDISLNYMQREWKYGSPIRVCKKCNQKYIDKRYHEIAVEGINPDTFDLKKSLISLLLGVILLVLSVVINGITIFTGGYYYSKIAFLGVAGIAIIIFMIIDIIRMKTGLKERRLEKVMLESVNRLQNKEYAHELASVGYNVPEKYL